MGTFGNSFILMLSILKFDNVIFFFKAPDVGMW